MVQIVDIEGGPGDGEQDEDASPIEEVQMTVPTGDDTTLPVWTFRMWALRLVSCVLMSFLNQFFSYRIEPIVVTQITVQVASLPLGHFLARVLPVRKFKAPALLGGGGGEFSPSGGSSSPAPWPSCSRCPSASSRRRRTRRLGSTSYPSTSSGLSSPASPSPTSSSRRTGYVSPSQAVSFLADFKLGHYMKIPPRSMFLVQLVGTVVAATVNLGVAYWLLGSVPNICQDTLLPANSPWTCPNDRVFFDASVIWGLVGPRCIFGALGNYVTLNWFILAGAAGPAIVYALHRAFPAKRWIRMVNLPA
jgi:hypothetical protein